MARVQVQRDLGRERIRPVAAPVDTFARPTAGFGLSELAEGLKDFAPALAQYSDVEARKKAVKDKQAGEDMARELYESGKSYREAIKSGKIKPHESSWFQLGAREQYGHIMAGRFKSDLAEAIGEDEGMQAETDPAKFDAFVSKFREGWVANNLGDDTRHGDFERGFGNIEQQYVADLREQFATDAGKRLVEQVGARQYESIFQHLEHEYTLGTNEDAIAEGVNILNDRMIAAGLDPRVANQAAIKAVTDYATLTGSLKTLDMLRKVRGGKGAFLFGTIQGQSAYQKAREEIVRTKQNAAVDARQNEAYERNERVRTEVGAITSELLTAPNPQTLNLSARLAKLAKDDPNAAEGIIRFRSVMSQEAFESDPQVFQDTLKDIILAKPGSSNYVTEKRLVSLMHPGSLNARDFQTLLSHVQRRDDKAEADARRAEGKEGKGAYEDRQFQQALSAMPRLFEKDGKLDKARGQKAANAQAEFIDRWLRWRSTEGANAGEREVNEYLTWMRDQVVNYHRGDEINKEIESDEGGAKKPNLTGSGTAGFTDWRTTRMTSDPRWLDFLERSFNSRSLDARTKATLRRNGISGEDVPEFIAAQRRLMQKSVK